MEKIKPTELTKTKVNTVSQETVNTLRRYTPEHPALNRMRAKVMQDSGVQAISAYDRMHHRHNRS